MADGCCPPGSIGAVPLSNESTKGVIESIEVDGINPLPCYRTGSPLGEAKRVVLIFTDVFGIDSGHHKAVADRLADKLGDHDTAVLIPDFFRGFPMCIHPSWLPSSVNLFFSLPQIFLNGKFRITDASLERDITKVLYPWLVAQTDGRIETGFSCVGFCFGGWLIAKILSLPDLPVKCCVGIHPSFRIEHIHGRSEEELARKTGTKPILLLPAENDTLKPGKHEAVKIMAEARNLNEEEISIEFPTMRHGWVTRGDSSRPDICENQLKALQMTMDFIEKNHPV